MNSITFKEVTISLALGEHYAGVIIGNEGEPNHHLILLPGQVDDINWNEAMAWAEKQGGEHKSSLPTRREQAVLFANLKEHFEERAYWSCEEHDTEPGWAWLPGLLLRRPDHHPQEHLLPRPGRPQINH